MGVPDGVCKGEPFSRWPICEASWYPLTGAVLKLATPIQAVASTKSSNRGRTECVLFFNGIDR